MSSPGSPIMRGRELKYVIQAILGLLRLSPLTRGRELKYLPGRSDDAGGGRPSRGGVNCLQIRNGVNLAVDQKVRYTEQKRLRGKGRGRAERAA